MFRQFILLMLLLLSATAFTQSPATSPSRKEIINQLETATPMAQPAPARKRSEPASPPPHVNPGPDPALAAIAAEGLNQRVAPATVLSNNELLIRGKTIYVISDSFFVKREQIERGLLDRKELGDWGLHVVHTPENADLILKVRRAPFQNNFPFTITDRISGIVVMGGTVNSLFGTVPGKIAARLAEKLKEIKGKQ